MDHFQLVDGEMHCEGVKLAEIAAEVGTPVYVYSTATMVRQAAVMAAALAPLPDPLIAYAVKANPNAAVLATLARAGLGADIVSGGEYHRARAAGMASDKIVFSGVGKTEQEMAEALKGGLYQFNLELLEEAETLSAVATVARPRPPRSAFASIRASRPAPTPRSPPAPPPTSSAFRSTTALDAYRAASVLPGLAVQGVAVHIGSQLTDLAPLEAAFTRVGALIEKLRARRPSDRGRRSRRRPRHSLQSRHAGPAEPARLWRDGAAHRRRLGRPAGVRAGAPHRRQCRRASDPRHPGRSAGSTIPS